MKRFIAIVILAVAQASLCARADDATNALAQARLAYLEARKAYIAARRAAGITNSVRRVAKGTTTTATTFTKAQKKFFENRRICVSRDTTTIPGSVITTWFRNGKLDTQAPAIVTNVLHDIQGAVQENPLQGRIEELQGRVAELVERATSAEARAARLNVLKTWLEEQRDKAVLPTTKAIYQAIIDKIDEKLEG